MTKINYTHEEVIGIYDQLIATIPGQKRKGAKSNYTSLNGHMFSFVDGEGNMSIRFSEAEKQALMEKYNASESIQYNSVMRGYIVVPDNILGDLELMKNLFKQSFDYISSLKPKPSKKSK